MLSLAVVSSAARWPPAEAWPPACEQIHFLVLKQLYEVSMGKTEEEMVRGGGWMERRGAGRCEKKKKDWERLGALHRTRGKSKQAISKPRRSTAATLAPHNYNTI